jgi:hypothetical protein
MRLEPGNSRSVTATPTCHHHNKQVSSSHYSSEAVPHSTTVDLCNFLPSQLYKRYTLIPTQHVLQLVYNELFWSSPFPILSTRPHRPHHSRISFTYLLHGAQYYLKSWLSFSLSKNILLALFMEPEGSSPCSQKPATGSYPEPAESSSPHRSLSPQGPS